MKMMLSMMNECDEKLKKYMEKKERNGDIMEMKEVMERFKNDVIGYCDFGINFK